MSIVAKLPHGAGSIECVLVQGKPTACPRCGRRATLILAYMRQVDQGRTTIHCGCMTQAERNGAVAPQNYGNIINERAWQKTVDKRLQEI